jgi:hypothetical protein
MQHVSEPSAVCILIPDYISAPYVKWSLFQDVGLYSGRNITPSSDDRYKYTRGREGKTVKR